MTTLAGVLLAVVVVLVVWGIVVYNELVGRSERTREAWSGIDVQLRRRASQIPNVVEAVRAYATHERGVFDDVTRARAGLERAKGPVESAQANQELTNALGRLFVVVENYPQLRASENFQELQRDLSDVEEKIAFARQFYNRNAAEFNARIRAVPGVLVARLAGLQRCEFFEADQEGRAEVHVDFASTQLPAAAPGSLKEPPRAGET